MIPKVFLSLAALLEGGLVPVLLFDERYHGDWVGLLILHVMVSIAVGLLGKESLPPTYQRNPLVVMIFFTAMALFIPMLGTIGILALVLLTNYAMVQKTGGTIQELHDSRFSDVGRLDFVQFGRGDLQSRFQASALRTETRLDALGKLQGFETQQIQTTVRQALQDQADDIRLVAFGILEKKEKSINARINQELEWFQQSKDEQDKLTHARELAYAYWELVYKDVVEGDILQYALEQATRYNTLVLSADPSDAGMWALQGQILLRTNECEKAQAAFTNARDYGIPDTRVVPYLAEIAFIQKDFSELANLFRAGERLSEISILTPLIRYWSTSQAHAQENLAASTRV